MCLAGIELESTDISCCSASQAKAVLTADLDNDGDLDVASGSSAKIAWYENLGQGQTSFQRPIRSGGTFIALAAADIDNDGYTDIVFAEEGFENILGWMKNVGGTGEFQSVTIRAGETADAIAAKDIDGDGDIDIAFAHRTDGRFSWRKNLDGKGKFGPAIDIARAMPGPTSVVLADLDGDDREDLVTASFFDNKITWFRNTGGAFGRAQTVATSALRLSLVRTGDIDHDGDLDLVSAAQGDGTIAWYENTNGQGAFSAAKVISTEAIGATSLIAADIDGDGDVDIASSSWKNVVTDSRLTWFENTDGKGTYGTARFVTTEHKSIDAILAADLNDDGSLDIVTASAYLGGSVAWYPNMNSKGDFGDRNLLTAEVSVPVVSAIADFDGDGWKDIAISRGGGSPPNFGWFRNQHFGQFGTFQGAPITASIRSLHAADVDSDGDVDVVYASHAELTNGTLRYNEVGWIENLDGQGTFGSQKVISTQALGAKLVAVADMDQDGDLDVISGSELRTFDGSPRQDKVLWYENVDGRGGFGGERIITTSAIAITSISVGDSDGDGDTDVLVSSMGDHSVSWYTNVDGRGTFERGIAMADDFNRPMVATVIDLDGDGDVDVAVATYGQFSTKDGELSWFENLDGKGRFSSRNLLAGNESGRKYLSAVDFDGDGDVDLLSGTEHSLKYYENIDGGGQFADAQDVYGSRMTAISVGDMNNDGRIDILTINSFDGRVTLSMQKRVTILGDVNHDGFFDSSDLVLVFQSGKYESTLPAAFEDGDWDGDGLFGTSDLVAAFQAGQYEVPR